MLQERSTVIVVIEHCRQNSCSVSASIKLNLGQSAGRADMAEGYVWGAGTGRLVYGLSVHLLI